MPTVEVRQGMADILFELEDGRLLHLEFQSTKEPSLHRFAGYDLAIHSKYRRKIRTVVLYTGDVSKAPEELDAGTLRYQVENVYMNQLDGDEALDTLKWHLETKNWTETDRVRLAFAFHMGFRKRTRDEAFSEIVELVQRLPDREEQNYVAALILGFSGRILSDEQMETLKEALGMADLLKAIKEEGKKEGRQEEKREVAKRMFQEGASLEYVVKVTGLSEADAEEIRRKVAP